jgi:hypothetical protein
MNLDDKNKVEILRALLSQFWTEVIHWREDSWRFTGWLVSVFILLAGVSVFKQQGAVFASAILLILSIGGTLYLRKNYDNYVDRLGMFRNVEEALLLFEENAYIQGKSILPKEKLHSLPTKTGTRIYIGTIWFVAGAAIIAMWLGVPK